MNDFFYLSPFFKIENKAITLSGCLVILLFGCQEVCLEDSTLILFFFYLLIFFLLQSSLPIIVVWIDSESDRKMEQK